MIQKEHVYLAPALENYMNNALVCTMWDVQDTAYLGYRLGALGNGVLGELTRENETYGSLNLTR